MKRKILYSFTVFIVVYGLWYFLYPETLACVEGNSFFAWIPDYLNLLISQPAGIGLLLSDFLSQFFRWREIGAMIQASFALLVLESICFLLDRMNKNTNQWMKILFVGAFVLLQVKWYVASFSLQFLIFLGTLILYSIIKQINIRRIIAFVLFPVLFVLLAPGIVILIYVSFFFYELFFYEQKNTALLWSLITLLFVALFPLVWSRFFSFVSVENQYRFITQLGKPVYPIYLLYFGIVSFIFLAQKNIIKNRYLNLVLEGGITLLVVFFLIVNSSAREREKFVAVEHFAMAEDWDKVLSKITKEEALNDIRLQKYALLALNGKRQLVDNIFRFHPSGPDCFYFYLSNNPFSQRFNSLFYSSIGLYNEAIRQTFEASLQTENGITFQGLRQTTDWFLKIGNAQVVGKYLKILQKSTCHKGWVGRRQALLDALNSKSIKFKPEEGKSLFASAYPFTQEMALVLEKDPTDIKKEEYFLMALLIEKDLDKFLRAIKSLPYSKQKEQLPIAFQQAIAIIGENNPEVIDQFMISSNIQQAYKKFLTQLSQKSVVSSNSYDSYWGFYWMGE
jgi:hypothetical protein